MKKIISLFYLAMLVMLIPLQVNAEGLDSNGDDNIMHTAVSSVESDVDYDEIDSIVNSMGFDETNEAIRLYSLKDQMSHKDTVVLRALHIHLEEMVKGNNIVVGSVIGSAFVLLVVLVAGTLMSQKGDSNSTEEINEES